MKAGCRCINCITPPHVLKRLLESKSEDVRRAALSTMMSTAFLRGRRDAYAGLAFPTAAPGTGRRSIFDCRGSDSLASAQLIRSEGGPPSKDSSVNRAFDGFGEVRKFFLDVLGRNSINGHGSSLQGFVHRGFHYNNAFWDGHVMVFGDGDGIIFTDFTKSLDVIAHELTHGVTEFTANLEYHNQPGALNESISDVFGSVIKQWSLGQKSSEADWLVGTEIFTPQINADALRSLKAPGTAYDNESLGKDPQPAHIDDFVHLPDTAEDDWGGVHINSGIPNKAFYLVAVGLGGNSWEAPAHIWYESLKASNESTNFQEFANTTFQKAGIHGNAAQKVVREAWREVGIRIVENPSAGSEHPAAAASSKSFAAMTRQLEALAAQIEALSKDVKQLQTQKD